LGRHQQRLGLLAQAADTLQRLASYRDLPAETAEEVQSRLAEIYLYRHNYPKARRHLTAALRYDPDNAQYHYLLARAVEADSDVDPRRALRHYRQAVRLDPDHALYQSDYGLVGVRMGNVKEGLTALRRAYALAPDDPEVVETVAEGLREAGETEEAGAKLRAALFRNTNDHRFRALWSQHQFQLLHAEQTLRRTRLVPADAEGPVLLPFLRPVPAPLGTRTLRRDAPAPPAGPKRSRYPRHSDKKQAP
jgi:tetratricopeptide (TPR) repeat protein